MADEATTDAQPGDRVDGDMVTGTVAQVRRELEARRRSGELPRLPAGELERHFDGVVEAVDGALVERAPIGVDGLQDTARLETWRARGGLRNRVLGLVLVPFARLFGAIVRRQVGPFAQRTAEVVVELVDRQERMQRFLARAHLDRIRGLEYRVAELEREVRALRDGGGGAA
jgi:hypothetical protein